MGVRVGARACTRDATHVSACVCARVWVGLRVRLSYARMCVHACICMHDLPY